MTLLMCNTYGASVDPGIAWVGTALFQKIVETPATATATCNVWPSGNITNHTGASVADWRLPNEASFGDDYEIYFSSVSGPVPNFGAALNVWHPMIGGLAKTIGRTRNTGIGVDNTWANVKIRHKLSQVVSIDKDINISATVDTSN